MAAAEQDGAAPAAPFLTDTCRSCGARIIWATTEHGRAMPVDAEPSEHGNVELRSRAADPLAVVVSKERRAGRTDLRTSHFTTCPQRDRWRTRGRR